MTYIRNNVDKTIEELLRLKSVELGYLADVTQYTSSKAYHDANEVIRQDVGYIVPIFGVGTPYKRGEIDKVGIYINRGNDYAKRNSGYGHYYVFDTANDDYIKYFTSLHIYDCEYEIRWVANDADAFRVAEQIVRTTFALPFHNLIIYDTDNNTWTLSGESKYIEISSYSQVISTDEMFEHLMRIKIHDIPLDPDVFIERVPKLTQVTGNIQPI